MKENKLQSTCGKQKQNITSGNEIAKVKCNFKSIRVTTKRIICIC